MVDSTEAGLVSSTVGDGLIGRAVVGKLLGMDVDVASWCCEVMGALGSVIVLVAVVSSPIVFGCVSKPLESGIVLDAVVSSPIVFGCVSSAVVEIAVEETVGNVV